MITAKEVISILNEDRLDNDTWLKAAKNEITEKIIKQIKYKNDMFIISKKPERNSANNLNAIFYDYAKMEMLCSELINSGFYVTFSNYVLKISCNNIFAAGKIITPWRERIEEKARTHWETKNKKA